MRAGFTLVEVMVAVAVASLLIVGVAASTQAMARTAQRQKEDARGEETRARAVELLRQDWRGRVRLIPRTAPPPAGTRVLQLSTTGDSIGEPDVRCSRLVVYSASQQGLFRKEGGVEFQLLPGPVLMEFWDGVAWRPEPGGRQPAVRLQLQHPDETVTLR